MQRGAVGSYHGECEFGYAIDERAVGLEGSLEPRHGFVGCELLYRLEAELMPDDVFERFLLPKVCRVVWVREQMG